MGTPDFAIPAFQAIVVSETVIAVVTQPDRPKGRKGVLSPPPIKIAAENLGIPIFQPERLKKSPELIEKLRALNPDLIVVIAFGQILPESVLEIPRHGCINVHASLLPKYRGAGPIQWAIIRGESETGVTTMMMDVGMDTGPMLLKKTLKIEADETAAALSPKLAELGASLLLETVRALKAGQLKSELQDNAKATLAPLLKKSEGFVTWEASSQSIYNRWRGLFPWPGLTTYYQNKRWKVCAMKVGHEKGKTAAPGTLLALSNQGLEVATDDGYILIQGLQAEGKREMTPIEYAAGHRIELGCILRQSKDEKS